MIKELRQGKNQLSVVGTLKSKKVTEGVNSNGVKSISIELTIQSEENDKIHANVVRLFSMESSKLYKSHKTIATEYKSIEECGEELADRIKVTGTLEVDEYVSKQDGQLKSINKLRGTFVNRVDVETKDEVGLVAEVVILSHADEIKDGQLTGRKNVKVLNVGYKNKINEFKNVVIEKDLAQQFTQLFPIGSTGELFIKVNNYAEKEQREEVSNNGFSGFGVQLNNMPSDTVTNYVNELQIIGGNPASAILNQYSREDVAEMKNLLEKSREEKLSVPSTPVVQNGFGSGFQSIDANDMPF